MHDGGPESLRRIDVKSAAQKYGAKPGTSDQSLRASCAVVIVATSLLARRAGRVFWLVACVLVCSGVRFAPEDERAEFGAGHDIHCPVVVQVYGQHG
jgi:hypothetical protein